MRLERFAAVLLAGVKRLEQTAADELAAYAKAGGLLVIFPPTRGTQDAWQKARLLRARVGEVASAPGEKKLKLGQVAPNVPPVATLPAEGLDSILIGKLRTLQPTPASETLIYTEDGKPFLLRESLGRGRVYLFAVTAQLDFSNFPLTPPFLLLLHRILGSHVAEFVEPLSHAAGTPVRLRSGGRQSALITPDGRRLQPQERAGELVVEGADVAGVYYAQTPGGRAAAFAVNVPPEESELERVSPERVRDLLPEVAVDFTDGSAGGVELAPLAGSERAALSFPLAMAALAFLVGEVALALSISLRAHSAAKAIETEG